MANAVTMTFKADTGQATAGFRTVGDSATSMSKQVDGATDGFSRAGEAADGAEGKARGFSDTLAGSADVATGAAAVFKGDLFGGMLMVGTGVADLAGGFSQFLLPMLEKTKIATLAKAAADRVASAGARVWAAGQWLLNASLLASPITWIVLGIVALVAVIVLIATKTSWFKDAWNAAWRTIKSVASGVWDWLKKLPDSFGKAFDDITGYIAAPFTDAWAAVTTATTTAWNWLLGLPKGLGPAFKQVKDLITAPFKLAFNLVADMWNKTMGRVRFTIPAWVPKMGGKGWGFPTMPKLHAGGVVPGRPGQAVPILALAGERVSSPAGAAGGGGRVVLGSDGTRLGDAMLDLIATAMRARGGDPAQLGIAAGGIGTL